MELGGFSMAAGVRQVALFGVSCGRACLVGLLDAGIRAAEIVLTAAAIGTTTSV
jgi:hypothetical protein